MARSMAKQPKQTTLYGIREVSTGKMLKVTAQGNNGDDYCGDVSAELRTWGSIPWFTERYEVAERVLNEHIPWYNSDIDIPEFNPDDRSKFEIFSVTF